MGEGGQTLPHDFLEIEDYQLATTGGFVDAFEDLVLPEEPFPYPIHYLKPRRR